MNFAEYMELAEMVRSYDPKVRDIVLTSETPAVLALARKRAHSEKGRWRFIFNAADDDAEHTYNLRHKDRRADKVALTALHLLLRSGYMILNGNSWWEFLIGKLAEDGGCAFVPRPHIIWLDK